MGDSCLPTLDGFICERLGKRIGNSYVTHPGWRTLYIRVGPRYVAEKQWPAVIDLANIEAEEYGQGTFKKLVAHLRESYRECGIYVESVLTSQFREGLIRMGFMVIAQYGAYEPNCFFLEPNCEKKEVNG